MDEHAAPVSATSLRLIRADPHVVLVLGAGAVLASEYGYRTRPSAAWLLLEAAFAGLALAEAWRRQERLRLPALIAIGFAFHAAWLALHFALGVRGDVDSSLVFRWQGNAILDGYYPRSEYPAGGVLLFALEAWLGSGTTRVANALLMVPFQLLCVACVWLCRTRFSPWFAAIVALWPLNAYSWEFKYDLVPAALLAVGLVLALRERWSLTGLVLGLGVTVKWTPGFSLLVLAVWLLASRRVRDALILVAAAAAAIAAVYAPILLWNAGAAAAAYSRQSGRSITPESIWWLLLRPLGFAHFGKHVAFPAHAARWADAVAVMVQAGAMASLLGVAIAVRSRPRAGVALAALAPTVFLLTNRIFSPQFMIVVLVAAGAAGALVVRSAREQLVVGVGLAGACLANAFVYPFALPYYWLTWQLASATLFVLATGVVVWLVLRMLSQGDGVDVERRPP